jgi:hypothetical protein
MSLADHIVGWTGFCLFGCVTAFQAACAVFYARFLVTTGVTDYTNRSALFIFSLAWLYPMACLNRLSVVSDSGAEVSISLVLFNTLVWAVGTVQFLAASPSPKIQKKNLYVMRALAAGLIAIVGFAAFLSSATRYCVLFAVLQLAAIFAWHFMSAGFTSQDLAAIFRGNPNRLVLLYGAFAVLALFALVIGMLSAGYANVLPRAVTLAFMLVCHSALAAIVTLAGRDDAPGENGRVVAQGSPVSSPESFAEDEVSMLGL